VRKVGTFVAAIAVVLCLAGAAVAAPAEPSIHAAPTDVQLFAGGGTPLTNGYFFPGTAIYDGKQFQGVPLQVKQGQNVQFTNLDYSTVTNAHEILSFKRKNGRPVFSTPLVKGPAQVLMVTSNLKPGIYPYFCAVHYQMFGEIQITK
jgi:hypothetical protein